MRLETVFHRVQKFQSFVYGALRWVEYSGSPSLEVDMHPRAIGSGCGRGPPGYDRLPARRFEILPVFPKALRPGNPGWSRFGA